MRLASSSIVLLQGRRPALHCCSAWWMEHTTFSMVGQLPEVPQSQDPIAEASFEPLVIVRWLMGVMKTIWRARAARGGPLRRLSGLVHGATRGKRHLAEIIRPPLPPSHKQHAKVWRSLLPWVVQSHRRHRRPRRPRAVGCGSCSRPGGTCLCRVGGITRCTT